MSRPGSKKNQGCAVGCLAFLGMAGCVFSFPTTAMLLNEGWTEAYPFFLPTALMCVVGFAGAAIAAYWRKRYASVEQDNDAPPQTPDQHENFPKLKTKSGIRGVKLAPGATPFAKFVLMLIIALFWNGITGAALYGVITDGPNGWEFWLVLGFLSLFVIIGLVLFGIMVHTFLRMLIVGGTAIEISKEPLMPGETARYFVVQSGNFQITTLDVKLECIEQVSYRQGTRTVSVDEKVHEVELAHCENIQARDRLPCHEGNFEIPEDAMHSFRATHNKVIWRLVVKMDIPNKPDVDDDFEFRVTPKSY